VGGGFTQAPDGGGPPIAVQLVPFLLLGVVFYFLLVRPEQRRRRDHDQLVAGLKRNDQVVMSSGIHGRVMTLGDDVVTVEIAPKIQVQVDRSAIQTVRKPSGGTAVDKEKEKS
jgi:preprotein translocase subunit YajC